MIDKKHAHEFLICDVRRNINGIPMDDRLIMFCNRIDDGKADCVMCDARLTDDNLAMIGRSVFKRGAMFVGACGCCYDRHGDNIARAFAERAAEFMGLTGAAVMPS